MPSKYCAACGGRYPGDALFCPTDGRPLASAAADREGADPYLGQEISGHIEIQKLVGVGAMGRVYRAFQRGIDRDVAVKILHRELSANAQLVSRFTREAKVASRLQHPNVVQVLLAGQLPDRALYMVMEYLDGLSLQSALAAAGGALPLRRALRVALQLCDAVGEAHAQGIVHRDLKPENVMLVRRGSDPDFVKVLDFGIARITWSEQSVATAAGLIFGTARYISPEGAQGSAVGPASDVYSIGTLLYQMLSGRTPFDGDQAVGLLVQQIHDPAPPLRSIPRAAYVPEAISEVIMASLAKDPAAREPDAHALGQAIFDAAKIAGLSPDDFSRPLMGRESAAMRMAPETRTKQLDLTPDVAARMSPGAAAEEPNGVDRDGARPTAATAKWSPPTAFHARLAEAARGSSPEHPPTLVDPSARPRRVDETLDDVMLELPPRPASSPALVPTPSPGTAEAPTLRRSSDDDSGPLREVPRTVPGEADAPRRTEYTPPVPAAASALAVQVPSRPELARPASHPGLAPPAEEPRRSRAWLFVVLCFVLGAALAAGWAWKMGKIGGPDGEEERLVARATEALGKRRLYDPPGDNVRDITDEGLRRWPSDRRLVDVRVQAARELTSQAAAQRSAGDVHEALRLAKIAIELDPLDASARRLVDQCEGELASFSPSAAPPLSKPPAPPSATSGKLAVAPAVRPTRRPAGPAPPAITTSPAHPARADYKAALDASIAQPKLGQTVDLVARITPGQGEFESPGFTIAGPGMPGGVHMTAQVTGPGVFRASYAFLEEGRFEITFTTQVDGKAVAARRTLVAGEAPPPTPPAPTPTPAPAPTGSVKWM